MTRRLVPDDAWRLVERLFPEPPPRPKGGRPAVADRDVLTGIVFVLKTGISWDDLPIEMGCGCGMTCLRRLRDWQRAGTWPALVEQLRQALKNGNAIDWERAELDTNGRMRPGRTSPFLVVDRRRRQTIQLVRGRYYQQLLGPYPVQSQSAASSSP